MKTNFIILYETNYEELLYAIFDIIEKNIKPIEIVDEKKYIPNLFDSPFKIKKPPKINIFQKCLEKTNLNIMNVMQDVFLSNHPKKELIMYYFFKNALKYPDTILNRRNLKCVNVALKIQKYVHHETHKMKGFLRFKELENGSLYAKIETENLILFSLANHFKKRLPEENFLIHDVKRGLLAIYQHKKLNFMEEKNMKLLLLNQNKKEQEIESLWQTFFHTIAIEERKNKRCQMNFMPKKYWKYLIEMENTECKK